MAYLLGAERLFANEPTIEFGSVEVGKEGGAIGGGVGADSPTMSVSVMVKDGEEEVKCAAEKVKKMFEATSDLGDWEGGHALTVTVEIAEPEVGDSAETMRFNVTPGDGTSPKAFLRVKVK